MSSSILGSEWNLSPEGLSSVTQNGTIKDAKTVLKNALDSDLKIVGKPALINELSKSRSGKIVLQIQKIRNISAPKAKEESQAAPRMLKLTLTDGESYIQAIEMSPINTISREKTAPGTKVLVNGASVFSGYLLINSQNFTVLGGQVEQLYEKWLLAKSIQQNHQHISNEGAPPWVAFGCKIISGNQDKSFKSLEKNKDGNNDSEFEQQRKDAIAEASSGAVRKTFGGRVKQNVQPVQNNLQFNKGRNNERENDRGRRGKFSQKDDDVVEKLQRPSEKVSLFSFLEDKLPIAESKKPVENNSQPSFHAKQNNQSNQKDLRSQQKNEGNYARNENRTSYKPQSEKNNYSSYQKNERSSNQQNYNSSASKQSNSESVSSSNNKNLPQKSSSICNNANSKPSASENSNSNSIKNNADIPNNVNSYTPRNSQQNPYRNNERYSQQQNATSSVNSTQPQNQSGHYNSSRQQHRWDVNDSNRPITTPQYPNPNSYQQPNTQYSQKPQQNFIQNATLNAEMHHLANNLSKMSVSNEFASRSLRQHLNLGPPRRQEVQGGQGMVPNLLNIGDQCMARYWEDGKFYPATIAAITDKTYAVQFTGYGNIEEVLKHDCFSPANSHNQHRSQNNSYPQNQFSGTTMEFRSRRGPPRN